jgi:mannose-6-phosphate isomerase-like protein (cupin superfamily)
MPAYVTRIDELPAKRFANYDDGIVLRNVVRPELGGTSDLSINAVEVPANMGTPLHVHHLSEEAWVVTAGSGELLVDGGTHAFGTGDVLYVPPGVPHQLLARGDEPLKYIAITVPAVDLDHDNVVIAAFDSPKGR